MGAQWSWVILNLMTLKSGGVWDTCFQVYNCIFSQYDVCDDLLPKTDEENDSLYSGSGCEEFGAVYKVMYGTNLILMTCLSYYGILYLICSQV